MGIKHFWKFFKNNFGEYIHNIQRKQSFDELGIQVDNLMIDLNGIFHPSAQKIFKYGNHKLPPRLLNKRTKRRVGGLTKQIKVYEDVCLEIEKLLKLVNPKKRLILCVDGPAPLSKQCQQRQRRFKSANEKDDVEFNEFDSNCITPGTKFMNFLTKYIDWYIRKRISVSPIWQTIEVVFSNEKSPGEGEHKCLSFLRYYGGEDESYCIHGLDADLIMLSLGTHVPKFWILREDLYNRYNDFFVIDIGSTRTKLSEIMRWENDNNQFDPVSAVNDFIFICFMVGNDFLPHVPSLEIIEGGVDFMIDICKNVGDNHGHLTKYTSKGDVKFVKKSLKIFLETISHNDKEMIEDKLQRKDKFFPDPLIDSCSERNKGKWVIDMEKYKEKYYEKIGSDDMKVLCHQYLEGLQWVLTYYTKGVPSWKWCFQHHYAPFAGELAKHIDDFEHVEYRRTIPTTPYQQLLCVLPPKSAGLIPKPLCDLLTNPDSALKKYCPDKFEVDLGGKRQEWEGIVLLPMVDFKVVEEEYFKHLKDVDRRDIKRNRLGQSFVYFYKHESFLFKSFYGDIDSCRVRVEMLDL